MTEGAKHHIANRVARAITDAANRTGEAPSEADIREAILFVLNTTNTEDTYKYESRKSNPV